MSTKQESANDFWNCVFVLTPRFNMMTLTALLEPLRIANYLSPAQVYSHHFCSFDSNLVKSSNGMYQTCEAPKETLSRRSTIFVLASWGGENYKNTQLMSWLRLQHRKGVQICGIELGSFILAEAGLLADQRATTHWSYLQGFQEKYPRIDVVEQLFTQTSQIMTCAGGTASFDLMLFFISKYRGEKLAGEIADQIMHHPLRPPETSQRVTHGRGIDSLHANVRKAVEIIKANIEDPWRVSEIADGVGISQRQLERRFKAHFGCSVASFSQLLRLQHARVLLVSTDLSISEILTASGFNTQSHFNAVFKNCFDRKPSAYRTAWPENEQVPHWPGTLSTFIENIRLSGKRS